MLLTDEAAIRRDARRCLMLCHAAFFAVARWRYAMAMMPLLAAARHAPLTQKRQAPAARVAKFCHAFASYYLMLAICGGARGVVAPFIGSDDARQQDSAMTAGCLLIYAPRCRYAQRAC